MGTSRNILTATFDAATELKDAGAVTASGAAEVDGAPRVVDLGNAYVQATMIVDFDAMDTAGGDEAYEVRLQASSDPSFAKDVSIIATVRAGAGSVTGEQDVGIGRRSASFVNQGEDGQPLRYLRAYHVVDGGAATGSVNYRAFITKNALKGV